MLQRLNRFIDGVTMYRLILCALALLAAVAVIFAFADILPLDGTSLLASALILLAVSWGVNRALAAAFRAPLNLESWAITALILFFVITPAATAHSFWSLILAAVLAMASKYIVAVRGRHIFNPAAFGAVAAGLLGFAGSSWWISAPVMLPFVLAAGLLVVRKVRRFEMFFVFLVTALVAIFVFSAATGLLERIGFAALLWQASAAWPLIFFGTIMFTEPVTTPPARRHRLIYAAVTGLLFGTPFNIGGFYLTSEMALILANLYSFVASLKMRLLPALKEKRELAPGIFEFVFAPGRRLAFAPGQYLEWTLPHARPDSRGTRRYFTIASSPTEEELRITAKFAERSSSFKKALLALAPDGPGRQIAAGQLAGDFLLPEDPARPLVFIAGGVGITPFRSMVKHILDTGSKRDIVLFYAAADPKEFVYRDLFREAEAVGVKTVHVLAGAKAIPPDWTGQTGFIDKAMIESEVPGHRDRLYYLSGPPGMVGSYKRMILSLGILRKNIKTDYFTGY